MLINALALSQQPPPPRHPPCFDPPPYLLHLNTADRDLRLASAGALGAGGGGLLVLGHGGVAGGAHGVGLLGGLGSLLHLPARQTDRQMSGALH